MKKFRDKEGVLTVKLAELKELTYVEGREYFTPGNVYFSASDGKEYTLTNQNDSLTEFRSPNGSELTIPTESLGTFLCEVASEGMELVRVNY